MGIALQTWLKASEEEETGREPTRWTPVGVDIVRDVERMCMDEYEQEVAVHRLIYSFRPQQDNPQVIGRTLHRGTDAAVG